MVVDVVIDFPDGVLGAVLVGKVERYKRPLPGVWSIEPQQIVAKGIHYEARSLRNEVIRGILNADRTVPGGKHLTAIASPARDWSCRRDVTWKRVANGITLSFKGAKIKELVLNDVSATGDTKLLELDGGLVRANGIEVIASIKGVGAAEGIGGAVNLIGARLQADAGDGARLPAKFGLGIDLRVELLNCIDGNKRGCIAQDGCRVSYTQAHKCFVIGDAVDDKTGVLRANAVCGLRPRAAARVNRSARTQGDEILVVAAIQRQVVDDFVADGAAQRGGGGIHHGNFFGDGDRFSCRAGLEHGVDTDVLANLKQDVLALKSLETLVLGTNGIGTGEKVHSDICSIRIGGQSLRHTSSDVGDDHGGIADVAAGLVGDYT